MIIQNISFFVKPMRNLCYVIYNQSSQNIPLKSKLRPTSFQNVYFERLTLPTLISHPCRVFSIMSQKISIPDDELISGAITAPGCTTYDDQS